MHHTLRQALRLFALISFATASATMSTEAISQVQCETGASPFNTCFGLNALQSNLGTGNSAFGINALRENGDTALMNTAVGWFALAKNIDGEFSTAIGARSLQESTTSWANTAVGADSLGNNVTGSFNVAVGNYALFSNTTASNNSAFGYLALASNQTGGANTAQGTNALANNVTGSRNVAVGFDALFDSQTGTSNTAIGWKAGRFTTGNDNIVVGHRGVAGESQTMRLGRKGTEGVVNTGITRTFIAGIRGVTTGFPGAAVLIDRNGQLGTISSSRRYKQDIQTMAIASERLQRLRPVTFHYRQPDADGDQSIQYGLIAEEVAEVFPELVINGENGQPETVAYHVLPTLLLNELQKAQQVIKQQADQFAAQASEVNDLKRQMDEMKSLLLVLQTNSQESQVAMR